LQVGKFPFHSTKRCIGQRDAGTRDLLLSNTVRSHRTLRAASVEAQLEVYEGQSHAQYLFDDRLPETAVAFGEMGAFFDKHLGK
jgi:epsilon-lactone hydrolase